MASAVGLEGAIDREARVTRLIREYAQNPPGGARLDQRLTLRRDLAIESLALVSLAVRLGEEFDVNIVDLGIELGNLQTVGDLMAIAETLAAQPGSSPAGR